MQARVGELAGSLSARDLSTVLWGYGRLGAYPGVEVMETLISRARLQLADYSPHVRRPCALLAGWCCLYNHY